jgi:hypothetical protein
VTRARGAVLAPRPGVGKGAHMQIGLRGIAAGAVAVLAAACDGGGGHAPGADGTAARIDALEKRLAAVERGIEPVERLRNDAASLDRRVSTLETSVRELATRPAPPTAPAAGTPAAGTPPAGTAAPGAHPGPRSGPAAWNGPTTRPDRTARRAELRALSDEFRSRLSELRTQPGATDNSDKTREILDWYREQRRAILRGDGRTDQKPQ